MNDHIKVESLRMQYGDRLIQKDLNFSIHRQDIFVIMGGSGCGKSTLLKHMIGLIKPYQGHILVNNQSLWQASEKEKQRLMQSFGVSYQAGALISSMTLKENIAMPLELYTSLNTKEVAELVELKLMMVGLDGFENYYPSEISGGMLKRAALARAIALDPEILFFDEPSAGLDPISAKMLDDLILQLNESLKATIIVVTHELASIFAIATNCVFLDAKTKTMLTTGNPTELLNHCTIPEVSQFLRRGQTHQLDKEAD